MSILHGICFKFHDESVHLSVVCQPDLHLLEALIRTELHWEGVELFRSLIMGVLDLLVLNYQEAEVP
jgi:hypothetical protein